MDRLVERREITQDTFTNPDQFILSTGSKIPSIRAEADTANIQVSFTLNRVILQMLNLLPGLYVKDLGTTIAPSGNISAISTEPDTAHHAVVLKGVDKVDVECSGNPRVIDGKPIGALLFLIGRDPLRIKVGQIVSDWSWAWSGYMWGSAIRVLVRLMRMMNGCATRLRFFLGHAWPW